MIIYKIIFYKLCLLILCPLFFLTVQLLKQSTLANVFDFSFERRYNKFYSFFTSAMRIAGDINYLKQRAEFLITSSGEK